MNLINFILNIVIFTLKINSHFIGILSPPIINPSGKFYDFINGSAVKYSKVDCIKAMDNKWEIMRDQDKKYKL